MSIPILNSKMKPIPYGRQSISEEDIRTVIETLQSDYLTQGPMIPQFEKDFAEYVGAKYAVAVSNGTAALHLGALALGVKPGDKVITTPITFAASANCVGYCGGEIEFVDIDPNTYLIDIKLVREKLQASPKGTYKGIIPVDFAGRAVAMQELRDLADEYDLWIMEDACHAPGGFSKDSSGIPLLCGGGLADLGVFSFHPVKHIATGEGGMVTTNNPELYEKLFELRTHGITRDVNKFKNSIEFAAGVSSCERESYPGWYMEMQTLGYNYRLTDFQAALGVSQLKRADHGLEIRRGIAKKYYQEFKDCDFIKGQSGAVEGHAYHLYILEVEDRVGLYDYLRSHQIYAQIHYVPTHMMPFYQQKGWKQGDLPQAEEYYKHCISLPMYPTLKEEEQEFVIQMVKSYYSNS